MNAYESTTKSLLEMSRLAREAAEAAHMIGTKIQMRRLNKQLRHINRGVKLLFSEYEDAEKIVKDKHKQAEENQEPLKGYFMTEEKNEL